MQDDGTTGGEAVETVTVEDTIPPVVEVPDTEPVPVAEPVVTSDPVPEPIPEPVVESLPEPVPEAIPVPEAVPEVPVVVHEPEPVATPEEAPPIVSTPPPVVDEPVVPKAEPEAAKPVEEKSVEPPAPIPEPPKNTNGIPQKVLDLTPYELDAARRLWAMQNIKSVQAKSAHDRTVRRDALLREIQSYIKSNSPATLSMIAYHANISPRKASDYLRILTKAKRIQATGATTSRRYS